MVACACGASETKTSGVRIHGVDRLPRLAYQEQVVYCLHVVLSASVFSIIFSVVRWEPVRLLRSILATILKRNDFKQVTQLDSTQWFTKVFILTKMSYLFQKLVEGVSCI